MQWRFFCINTEGEINEVQKKDMHGYKQGGQGHTRYGLSLFTFENMRFNN